MNPYSVLFLTVLPLFAPPSCRTKRNLPEDIKKNMPAHEETAPPRKPNTGANPAASGTRSDYTPTTGPAGQQETNPGAPPASTNPAPSNPNTPPPPPPEKAPAR